MEVNYFELYAKTAYSFSPDKPQGYDIISDDYHKITYNVLLKAHALLMGLPIEIPNDEIFVQNCMGTKCICMRVSFRHGSLMRLENMYKEYDYYNSYSDAKAFIKIMDYDIVSMIKSLEAKDDSFSCDLELNNLSKKTKAEYNDDELCDVLCQVQTKTSYEIAVSKAARGYSM